MNSYKEYPIKCKTCNAQIACFEEIFETLIEDHTIEEALNEIGARNYCCRTAFMNPTKVYLNMENRALIEGIISIDLADKQGPNMKYQHGNPTFSTCIKDESTSIISKPAVNIKMELPALNLSETGIAINKEENRNFDVPSEVGTNVINKSNYPNTSRDVGVGKKVEILSGRTYLCR